MNLNPFRHITKLLEKILMNQQELAQALTDVQTNVAAISAGVDKVGVESQASRTSGATTCRPMRVG
jgi:retron-type reverse transcriptase